MSGGTREKIVQAAMDRFHALGFNGCGVQEIVDAAGVPKGSFYNHFKAKELLAIEVLDTYTKGSRRDLLLDEAVPPLDRLRNHFGFLASRYEANGYTRGCLIGNFAAETADGMPELREALDRSLTRWTATVAGVIHQGQADGSIVADLDPDQAARFLISAWEGAVMRMKVAKSGESLDDFFAVVFPRLQRG